MARGCTHWSRHVSRTTDVFRIGRACAVASRIAVAMSLAGCIDDRASTAPSGASRTTLVGLSLAAQVQAAAATGVQLRATYARAAGTRVELARLTVALQQQLTQQVPFSVDLGPCLAETGRPSCDVYVEGQLLRNTIVLDSREVGPLTVTPGIPPKALAEITLYEVKRIVLSAFSALEPDDTVDVTATALDTTGAPVAGTALQWSSADPAVLTATRLDATRLRLIANSAGTARVRAVLGARTFEIPVPVRVPAVATLTLAPKSVPLTAGAVQQLTVQLFDKRQRQLATAGRIVTYQSSSTSVASVSATGLITAVAPGTATITATSEGKSDVAQVTVTAAASLDLRISGLPLGVAPSVTITGPSSFTQPISAPQSLIRLPGPGTYTITASNVSGSGQTYAPSPTSQTVTVAAGQTVIASIAYAATLGSLAVTVSGLPAGVNAAITVTGPAGFTRGVTGTQTIAGLAPGGYAIAAAPVTSGTQTFTASVPSQQVSVSAGQTATVTVAYGITPVARVTVTPGSLSVQVGQSAPLAATTFDASGAVLTGRTVTWSSSNGAVATVAPNGSVTGVAVGTAIITATSEGKTGSASVTVTQVPVGAVTVSPAPLSIPVGQTGQLTATTLDALGNVLTGRLVTWTSSNNSVASVSSGGLVTGVALGSATVTATSEGISAPVSVTVIPVPVATVTVAPSPVLLTPTQKITFVATTKDAVGNVLVGRVVTWSSSNPAVSGVSSGGVDSAVSVGTATITATSEGKIGTVTVTVASVPPPVATVTVTPSSQSLKVGFATQLTATTRDASGNVVIGRVITWNSSNPTAATVNSSGVVTGIAAAGTVTITATSEGKNGAATVTVVP
jgi:uncharacterized protein YjdB